MNKSIKILLVVLTLITIGGICFYIYSKYFSLPAQLAKETTDWQTYMNEQYDFSFKYPKNWTLNINEENLFTISLTSPEMQDMMVKEMPDASPEISLEIKDNPEKVPLEEIIEKNELYLKGTKSKVVIAGRKGYRAEFSGMVNSIIYFWEDKSNIFSLGAWSKQEVQKNILSTFKFLPSTPQP
jgi:hypothetical protein